MFFPYNKSYKSPLTIQSLVSNGPLPVFSDLNIFGSNSFL